MLSVVIFLQFEILHQTFLQKNFLLRITAVPLWVMKVIWRPSDVLSFHFYLCSTETRPHFNEVQVGQIHLRINILHKEYTVKLLNQKCEKKSHMFDQVGFKFFHFNKNHVQF